MLALSGKVILCGQRRPSAILLKSFGWRRTIGASISGHRAAEAERGAGGVARSPAVEGSLPFGTALFGALGLVTTFRPYPEPRPGWEQVHDATRSASLVNGVTTRLSKIVTQAEKWGE